MIEATLLKEEVVGRTVVQTFEESGMEIVCSACGSLRWGTSDYENVLATNPAAKASHDAILADPCACGGRMVVRAYTHRFKERLRLCARCESTDVQERFSMGITAGHWCEEHWATAPYRKDAQYDYLDAGEYYGEDDY